MAVPSDRCYHPVHLNLFYCTDRILKAATTFLQALPSTPLSYIAAARNFLRNLTRHGSSEKVNTQKVTGVAVLPRDEAEDGYRTARTWS
ncbi:hypothetical protein HQN89_14525 [Paenibacillus frigoriresistens]|uniref:hypothetical protein n=1 Tax=Paenibacillus alginolyticus TaxID=59839 RepID=UPI00156414CF|nr:hypothetical protein [Paenibacillus frigoriresistens]NRF92224.1 hypothetical protein [Paenibacillus frigoriresistens]